MLRIFGVACGSSRRFWGFAPQLKAMRRRIALPTLKVFASKKHFPAHGGQAVRKSRGACDPRKNAQPQNRSGSHDADHPPSAGSRRHVRHLGWTRPLASLPLQSLADDPPSSGFGVASTSAISDGRAPWRACHYSHSQATRLPLQIHQSTLAGELARFSREFPHNRFPVAATDEAAASDVASASGLEAAGSLQLA